MKPNESLKHARQQVGWTQKRLASELGVSLRNYQHLEYGSRKISLETALKACDVLGMTFYELFGRNPTTKNGNAKERQAAASQ